FPFSSKRFFILAILSVAGLLCQYFYLSGRGYPWYLAVVIWLVGLWILLGPCFSARKNGASTKTILQIGSVPFALPFSVQEKTDTESSRANTFILLIVLLAACLYIVRLTDFPTDVHGDSAEVALHGIQVRDSGRWTIFDPGWYQIPNLFFLIPAWVMWLFGDNLFGMRMADVLIALAAIPLFYITACRLFSQSASVLATFLFATSMYVVHYARMGIGYNQTTLLTIALLYCLIRGLQENDAKPFCWAGWLAGLGLLSYQASHLLLPLTVATLCLFFITGRIPFKNTLIYTVTFLVAFWVTVAPLVGSFLVSPDAVFSRANGVSIFSQEGRRMIHQSYPPDITDTDMLRGQIERSLLGPISYPDGSPYLINRVSGGMLDPLPAIFLISGLLILFFKLTNPVTLIFLFWIPVTLVTGSVLTNNAPSYQRLVGLIPLLILVAAPIPWAIVRHLKRCCTWSPRIHAALLCGFLAFLLITGGQRYFHEIMAQPQMVDHWTRIAHYLKDAGPTQYTYFFGPPYVYFEYGTMRFLAPEARGENVLKPEEFLSRKISRRGPVSFLLVHSNRRYLEELRHLYPGGREEMHTNCLGQEPFITYEVNF
ncbi:MAG TPA: glycosyltransferase family 39 protein, partial [bacterium]|nr:glycosyltransferase family 39 protein [bacterium]